jgi:hypothetical protein
VCGADYPCKTSVTCACLVKPIFFPNKPSPFPLITILLFLKKKKRIYLLIGSLNRVADLYLLKLEIKSYVLASNNTCFCFLKKKIKSFIGLCVHTHLERENTAKYLIYQNILWVKLLNLISSN